MIRWKVLNGNGEVENFKNIWSDMAKFVMTEDHRKVLGSTTKGDKRNTQLFDSKARRYNKELARGLAGLLINPSVPFFELTTGDDQLDEKPGVRDWLQKQQRKVQSVLNNSNFHIEAEPWLEGICGYGTGNLKINEDSEDIVNFLSKPIYKYRIDVNAKGDVDTIYYEYRETVRNLKRKWGDDNFSDSMKRMFKDKPEHEYTIIEAIEPYQDTYPGSRSRFKFSHTVVVENEDSVLNMPKRGNPKGFFEFPYAVTRFSRTSDERYGRGPGMDALPDTKSMNEEKKNFLVAGALRNAPPLQAEDNGLLRKISLKPYGVSYRRPGSKPIEPLFPSPASRESIEFLDMIDKELIETYMINLLRIAQADRQTATEIVERQDENFRGFSSVLARFTREGLQPVVNRTFGIMDRKGLIDDLPEELEGIPKLRVRFISMIARAQKAIQSQNNTRALQASAPIIQAKPEVLDNIDGDAWLKRNWSIFGADVDLLTKPSDVKKIREQRSQQQQKIEQEASAQANAETAKTVSETQAS